MNKHLILQLVKSKILKDRYEELNHLLIYFKDIDKDGIDEIVALYMINSDEYTTYLKHLNDDWVIFNKNIVSLFPAYINSVGGKKWGYINDKGKFIIEPIFDKAEDFNQEIAIIKKDVLYGVINLQGEYVVMPIYDDIQPIHDKRAVVSLKGEKSVINDNGEIITKKYYLDIGSYHNGLAFVKEKVNDKILTGYIDLNGEVAIPTKYQEASDFKDNKAIVKDIKYHLIDKDGKILNSYTYPYVGDYGDNRLVIKINDKCGYIDEDGEIIIKPKYTFCQAYSDKHAVITLESDNTNLYGLIDLNGDYVIDPIYNDLINLGNNRFALGKSRVKSKPYLGITYAVSNEKGELLTDFIYNNVDLYQNHLASASKKDKTFFINLKGELVKNLPVLSGKGSLSFYNNLIKANVDYEVFYIDEDGKIINYPNYIIPVNETLDVVINKYKPNPNYLVYYPQIEKISIQDKVNNKLKKMSRVQIVPTHIMYEYYGNFKVNNVIGDLLELELNGYKYPFGAAHGFPYLQYVHLNMNNGEFYHLADLFNENCRYKEILSKWVITHPQKDTFIDEKFKILEDPLFYVDENNLYIVFKPYDVAPYYLGFIKFKIPFSSVLECININGDFWTSFHEN